MKCAKKLGKSNEEFIIIWYNCNRESWQTNDIKNNATYCAA